MLILFILLIFGEVILVSFEFEITLFFIGDYILWEGI